MTAQIERVAKALSCSDANKNWERGIADEHIREVGNTVNGKAGKNGKALTP